MGHGKRWLFTVKNAKFEKETIGRGQEEEAGEDTLEGGQVFLQCFGNMCAYLRACVLDVLISVGVIDRVVENAERSD